MSENFEMRLDECPYCELEALRCGDKTRMSVLADVLYELDRASRLYPVWPTDPLHALAVLGEEFGELTKGMLQLSYEPHKTSKEEVGVEAIQTAAMAIRLAMSLDVYQYRECEQHIQGCSDV